MKGKVVLVNFWATWCPPCKYEIPTFIKLQNKYRNDGFEIIGVSIDQGNNKQILSFINDYKINYLVARQNKSTFNTFGEMVAVPTSFLINQEGKIEKKYSGIYPQFSFENEIRRLLKKS